MSVIVNKTVTHLCPFHHVSLPAQDKTAGANSTSAANAFEMRASQEQGTH